MKLKFIVFITICNFSYVVNSQSSIKDASLLSAKTKLIDAWIETKINHELIPGISVSVFNKDAILWEKGYGYADKENNVKLTPNTPLRTCSISKLFTAIATMQLEEKKLIDLEKDFSNYLPNFNPLVDNKNPTKKVSFKNILTHTSGLATEANIPYFIEIDFPNSNEILQDINTSNLLTQPDAEFRYSNLGYSLMGLAIKNIVKEDYNVFVQKNVINQLNLKDTYADIELMPNKEELGKGYGIRSKDGRKMFHPYSTRALSPAAGLISSSHDLAKFGKWVINLAEGSDSILNSSTLNKMIKPAWEDTVTNNKRGLGFRYYKQGNSNYFGHGGYCSGYRAVLMINSETNLGISVLMNVNDGSPYEIAFSIMNILNLDINYNPNQSLESLKRYEGTYDRANMPERIVIAPLSNKILVMDLFSRNPETTIWVLSPENNDAQTFKKEGDAIEGLLFFDKYKNGTLRFNRYYNYLIRMDN